MRKSRKRSSRMKGPKTAINRALNDVTTVVLNCKFVTITAGAAPTHAAYGFNAGSFANMADYATVFDQYRIKSATLFFMPLAAGYSIISGTSEIWNDGRYLVAIDTSDATALTTTDQYLEYPDVRHVPIFSQGRSDALQYITWTPKTAPDLGAITGAGVASPWIDTNALTVPFYGFKIYCPFAVNGVQLTDVYLTCEVELRRQC